MNQYFIAYDVRRKVLMFIKTDRPMNCGDVRKLIPGGNDISKRALQIWGMNKHKYVYAMTSVTEE